MRTQVAVVFSLMSLMSTGLVVASAAAPTLELDFLCYPQLGVCGQTPPCGPFVPPGGHVGVELIARQNGRPAPLIEVNDTDGSTLTDEAGRARFGITPRTGSSVTRFTIPGSDSFVDVPLTWTNVSIVLESAPTVALVGETAEATFRILATATGEPIVGAALTLRTADHAVLGSPPSDVHGRTVVNLSWRHEFTETFRVSSVSACGLPTSLVPEPFEIEWATSESARAPPTISFIAPAWQTHPLVSTQVRGGEAPLQVEYRLQSTDDWRSAPIMIPSGEHRVFVRATDARGRVSDVANALVGFDNVSPTWMFVGNARNPCGAVEVVIVDASSGLASGPLVVLDDRNVVGTNGRFTMDIADGGHKVALSAVDRAGNALDARFDLWCDLVPPVASLLIDGWTACSGAAWRVVDVGSSVDPSSVIVTREGVRVAATLIQDVIKIDFAEGRHPYRLVLKDQAENVLDREDVFACDREPPTVQLSKTGTSVGLFSTGAVVVMATSKDAGSGVSTMEMRIDGGEWRAIDSVVLAGEGTRLVEARATDLVGLTATTALTIALDTEPPTVVAPSIVDAGVDVVLSFRDEGSGLALIRITGPNNTTFEPDPADTVRVAGASLSEGRWFVIARDVTGHERAVAFSVRAPVAAPEPDSGGIEPADDAQAVETDSPSTSVPVPESNQTAVESATDPAADTGNESVAQEVYQLTAVTAARTQVFLAQPISVSGRGSGVERGVLILTAADGVEYEIARLEISGDGFRAAGFAPGAGSYTLLVRFATPDGTSFDHPVGKIEVTPDPVVGIQGSTPVPGPSVLALVLVALFVALVFVRRPKP